MRLALVLAREPVVERRAAEPVAVAHLDDRHAGGVERRGDRARPVRRVNWWARACEPSRRVESVSRYAGAARSRGRVGRARRPVMRDRSGGEARGRQRLADPDRGRGHDVEVAGVRRQVVAGAGDLEQDRDPARPRRRAS